MVGNASLKGRECEFHLPLKGKWIISPIPKHQPDAENFPSAPSRKGVGLNMNALNASLKHRLFEKSSTR